jgi:hypothetical protein
VDDSSKVVGQTTTLGNRRHSKILVDGGDPQETARIRQLIGFVDGQNGVDLVRNIKHMFDQSDHHVLVLAASIRNLLATADRAGHTCF